jgi:hypothetical protein
MNSSLLPPFIFFTSSGASWSGLKLLPFTCARAGHTQVAVEFQGALLRTACPLACSPLCLQRPPRQGTLGGSVQDAARGRRQAAPTSW